MCLCMKAGGEFAAFLKLYIYIYICDADKSILLTSQWPSASFLCCYIYMTKHYALFYLCMSFGINTDITPGTDNRLKKGIATDYIMYH